MSLLGLIRMHGQTGTIQRTNVTRDSGGATKDEWLPHLMEVKVFVQDMGGDEQQRYGRESPRRMANGYTESGQDIQAKDRFVIDSPARTFNILAAEPRSAGNLRMSHIKLTLEETDGSTA